ncbi:hypothetical protein SNEBB_006118 [Seison nebaliae]|nr:hypothetical protein SNEBB_006118 [Seison nebaliae]
MGAKNSTKRPDIHVRDAYYKPIGLNNTIGSCYPMSLLQVFMASPYLMMTLYQRNFCDDKICKVLNGIRNRDKLYINDLPLNTEYIFLTHEVMRMMGFHSTNQALGLACCKERVCTNADKRSCIIVNDNDAENNEINDFFSIFLKIVLYGQENFYNIFQSNHEIFKQRKLSFRTKQYPPDVNDNIWKTLKDIPITNSVPNFIEKFINTAEFFYKTDDQLMVDCLSKKSGLTSKSDNILLFYINFLYFGGGSVQQNDIVGYHITHNAITNLRFPTGPLPYEKSHGQHVLYIPKLNVIYVQVFFNSQRCLIYAPNIALKEFSNNFIQPDFIDHINELDPILKESTSNLLKTYNAPEIVFFSQGINRNIKFRTAYLVPNSDGKADLAESLAQFVEYYWKHSKIPSDLVRSTYRKPYQYNIKPFKLHPNSWNIFGSFKNQKILQHFDFADNKEEYKLFALVVDVNLDKFMIYPCNYTKYGEGFMNEIEPMVKELKDELYKRVVGRLSLIMNPYQIELIENYVIKISEYYIGRMMAFNYVQAHPSKTPFNSTQKKRLKFTIKEADGHSMAIVKALGNNQWWLINNESVTKLESIKIFLNEGSETHRPVDIDITVWERATTYTDLAEKLRPVIKTIKY